MTDTMPLNATLNATLNDKNNRQQQLENWLQQVFADQKFVLDSLPGDASARQYHRIQLADKDDATARYIVMDSADEQDALQQFINVAKLMAPAINVPTLVAQDVAKGFLVLQDFGTIEFAHLLVNATPEQINDHYQLAMQTLVALQTVPVETAKIQYQLPDYDTTLLNREMDLFSDWFIPYIGVELDNELWNTLKTALIQEVLQQPAVIVHRDYHSRNLMQDQADRSRLGVIDFQDAVIGSYTYDLVSLVRDAYVEWPEHQISGWIRDFWQLQQQAALTTTDSAEQLENDMNVMGVQRHLKVLGIFIRLSERDGKDRYLADIPKVMRDLLLELNWLAEHGNEAMQQALLPFNQWLADQVSPAYQEKFSSL
ncbi:aminoglycoside phosphotransferase family protein [Psychrobacter sp. K31L]|uniref:aminoglycoside phosphotransferase family protein n=1 Tax=Psychrobacter sp. K31L TaxID=2820758 RepID=UPI001B32398E|nr:phosphotransferase [Psychrobacter sp. K31L]MBP3945271.1 phosphotransferase [Psychrobacter sp. K31L]